MALVTAVSGSCFLSVAGSHQRKSICPLCFHWTWPSVYARLWQFLYHRAQLSSELLCVTVLHPGGQREVWVFLAGLSKKQKKHSQMPLRSSAIWCVGHFVIIFEDFAHKYLTSCIVEEASVIDGEKCWQPPWAPPTTCSACWISAPILTPQLRQERWSRGRWMLTLISSRASLHWYHSNWDCVLIFEYIFCF